MESEELPLETLLGKYEQGMRMANRFNQPKPSTADLNKALMKLLGQPGGEVRLPRLPVKDPESLRRMEEILVEAGLLGRTVEAA